MRGMPYTSASRKTDDRVPANSILAEALAKQAAMRPAPKPPKAMPVTPKLPKASRIKRNKRSG